MKLLFDFLFNLSVVSCFSVATAIVLYLVTMVLLRSSKLLTPSLLVL